MKELNFLAKSALLFLLIFVSVTTISSAQDANKSVYNNAVDQINCATISFIHREVGRAEVANNMQCLSFESIFESIPKDEEKTTGALCKTINEFKNKYKEGEKLDALLGKVIGFANTKIAAKPRKGNVADFKASLEKIKKDALDNAGGQKPADKPTTTTAESNAPTTTTTPNKPAQDTANAANTEPAIENAPKSSKKTDWIGLLALLVSLGALGLAYLAYAKAKKSGQNGSAAGYPSNTGNANTKDSVDAAMREIKRIEAKLGHDMAILSQKMEQLQNPGTGTAPSATIPEPEPIPYNPPAYTPAVNSIQSQPIAEPEIIEEIPEIREEEIEENLPEQVFYDTEPIHIPEEKAAPIFEEKPNPPVDLFAAPAPTANEIRIEPEIAKPVSEIIPKALPNDPEPFMPEKEYEDGEAVPFYKYAGLPDREGFFDLGSFTSDPVKDSVYEIEMYEDVPDKAFFSLLPNPEVIRKALLQPEIYLKPCCLYTGDPAGKRTIILVEEGMLRKQDNKWTIYEKAKINFE